MKYLLLLLLSLYWSSVAADPLVERYGALPTIQKMAISPSGERVVFRYVDSEKDLISVVSVNPVKPLRLLALDNITPRNVRFVGNDTIFMSVSQTTRVPGFKGKFEITVGKTYNIEKDKHRQLLIPGKDDVYAGQSRLDQIVGVSQDGKSVYIPAHSGEPGFMMGQQIDPPLSLFRVNLKGAGRARIHKLGREQVIDYFVNNDGQVLAREDFDEIENMHRIFAYQGKKPVEVFVEPTDVKTKGFIGVSVDEQQLFFSSSNDEHNRLALYTLSLLDGTIEGPVFNREDADVDGVITDLQRKVLGVRYSGFMPSYTFFDSDLDQRVQAVVDSFPNHSVWIQDISPDRRHLLVYVEGAQSAGDYFLYSKGQKTKFIASSRPTFPIDEIHPMTSVTFKSRDGLKIPTLITVPRTRIDDLKNLPAVVMPHGGPVSFDSISFDYMAQALAQQGYLVIQPQFRGSAGFGLEHQAAGYGEWGRKSLHDVSDAVGFFVNQGMVDSDRVCIVGASYGGYSALAGGAYTPELYKCVVSINGIGNLVDLLNRTKSERGRNSESLAYWRKQILGFDETDHSIAKARSPELAADQFTSPVLLIHSENDESVHPRQSITMYRALKKAKKQVEIVELKGEDHYLSIGTTRTQAISEIINFVNKYL